MTTAPDDGIPVVPDTVERLPLTGTCYFCDRAIDLIDGTWVDPAAPTDGLRPDGTWEPGHPTDDAIWRETCDENFLNRAGSHEPQTEEVRASELAEGQAWREYADGDGDWFVIDNLDQRGDTFIFVDTAGNETALDRDTVVERLV